jgi:hypothetical protein
LDIHRACEHVIGAADTSVGRPTATDPTTSDTASPATRATRRTRATGVIDGIGGLLSCRSWREASPIARRTPRGRERFPRGINGRPTA